MKMNYRLAQKLVDTLTCVAIEAQGGIPCDDTINVANRYANRKFIEIMNEFEAFCGEKWEIEIGD